MFATVPDVEAALQQSFDLSQIASATRLIQLVTARIRGQLGQHISPPQLASRTFRGARERKLRLPHPKAIPLEVSAVHVGEDELSSEAWQIDSMHVLTRTDGNPWSGDVLVAYSHGFPETPEDVVDVTVKLVVRDMTNPAGSTSVRLEGFAESWGTGEGAGPSEKDLIDSLRPRYQWTGVG